MTREKQGRRGPDAFEAAAAGVEHELRRLVPVPVPRGLRSRVLARASEARRGAVLRPWMRVAATACSVLIAALLALDPIQSRHEEARLTALLDGRVSIVSSSQGEAEVLETLIGRGTEAGRLTRLRNVATLAMKKNAEQEYFEARKWLKGWLANEDSENPD